MVGQFISSDLIRGKKFEEAAIPFLDGEDRQEFLSFVRHMLTWLPEERKTARELTEQPFLNLDGS